MNEDVKIHSTIEYSQFKLSPKNRKVCEKHVKDLSETIRKSNQLDVNPIIVNFDNEIVSGQHRWLVAQKLKVPIFYIRKDVPVEYFLTANLNQRRCEQVDAIKFYSNVMKFPDYIKLNNILTTSKASPGVICSLLGITSSCGYSDMIKSGKFKFKYDEERCNFMLSKYIETRNLLDTLPFMVRSAYRGINFCRGFNLLFEEKIDWKIFETRLRINYKMLDIVLHTGPLWLKRFKEMYNKRAIVNRLIEE
jgi:hypothetical protein